MQRLSMKLRITRYPDVCRLAVGLAVCLRCVGRRVELGDLVDTTVFVPLIMYLPPQISVLKHPCRRVYLWQAEPGGALNDNEEHLFVESPRLVPHPSSFNAT